MRWPLQFTPAFASDWRALKRLKAPCVGADEAVGKLSAYWSRLGFWPLRGPGFICSIWPSGEQVHHLRNAKSRRHILVLGRQASLLERCPVTGIRTADLQH